MAFDNALNLAWVLVAVVAMGALAVTELRRGAATLRSRCRRGIAVLIATVALFPCISASDDLVCLAQLPTVSSSQVQLVNSQLQEANRKPNLYLALQFESLESFQISSARYGLVTLSQFARVGQRAVQCCDRPMPSRAGRAPPETPIFA